MSKLAKVLISISIIAILMTIFIRLSFFQTFKYAIMQKDLAEIKQEYIIVKSCSVTGFDWLKIDGTSEYVELEGNYPRGFNYDFMTGENIFICYSNSYRTEKKDSEEYKIYTIYEWDILYPVARNSLFELLMPKNRICNFDLDK